MEGSDLLASLLLFGTLVLLSSFFSGSEIAFFSLQPSTRRMLGQSSSFFHKRIVKLLDTPDRLLITILVGNTVANMSAAVIAAFLAIRIAAAIGFPETAVVVLEIVAVTFVLLVLSEITPKVIALKHSVAYCMIAAVPISVFSILLRPLSFVLEGLTDLVRKRLEPLRPRRGITEEEMKLLADVGEEVGALRDLEHDIITNIADLHRLTVRHVMTARVDMVAMEISTPWPAIVARFRETGVSRMPIYKRDVDNVVGILYASDALRYVTDEKLPHGIELRTLLRAPLFVSESRTVESLIQEFRTSRTHIAIVTDEYGGVAGLVTLRDVLDEIVGEEARAAAAGVGGNVKQIDEDTFVMSGSTPITEVVELFNMSLDLGDAEYTTVAGFILSLSPGFPKVGDEFTHGNVQMKILAATKRRIVRVQVKRTTEKHLRL